MKEHFAFSIRQQLSLVLNECIDLQKMLNEMVGSDTYLDQALFAEKHGVSIADMSHIIEQFSLMSKKFQTSKSLNDPYTLWQSLDKSNFRSAEKGVLNVGDGEDLWKILEPFAKHVEYNHMYMQACDENISIFDLNYKLEECTQHYIKWRHKKFDNELFGSFDVGYYVSTFFGADDSIHEDLENVNELVSTHMVLERYILRDFAYAIVSQFY